VWRRRHRLQRLETEIAEGKAERAELRRRLEQFEIIAAAAGAPLPGESQPGTWQSGPVPAAPMPPSLLAAARDLRSWDVPVRLEVAGASAVAIVGGTGDPREWWSAIWQLASPAQPGQRTAPA
jgi:hypothetical protein